MSEDQVKAGAQPVPPLLQRLDARRALADLERDQAVGNRRLELFNARANVITMSPIIRPSARRVKLWLFEVRKRWGASARRVEEAVIRVRPCALRLSSQVPR
jgi:hypothetical protein